MALDAEERSLIAAIEDGLPIASRPYALVAERLGISEVTVVERLQSMLDRGIIKRFGVVVRHRALGFRANAMVVWDIPDEHVDDAGRQLARCEGVNLCYRRPRRPPWWQYNLFCMIHGRHRREVYARLHEVEHACGLTEYRHSVLFSTRAFKQRGARYTHRNETHDERVVANG